MTTKIQFGKLEKVVDSDSNFFLESVRMDWERKCGSRLPGFLSKLAKVGRTTYKQAVEHALADVRFQNIFTQYNKAVVREATEYVVENMLDDLTLGYIAHTKSVDEALAEKYNSRYSTLRHDARVAAIATVLAKDLGANLPGRVSAHLSGGLHDIGKYDTRHDVLYSHGRLTEEQFEEIKRHPIDGEIFARRHCVYLKQHPEIKNPDRDFKTWDAVMNAIGQHHWNIVDATDKERAEFNEQNPDKYMAKPSYGSKKGPDDVPSSLARLVAVADAHEAMLVRDYSKETNEGKAFTPEQAVIELYRDAGDGLRPGTHYDKSIVDKLARYVRN